METTYPSMNYTQRKDVGYLHTFEKLDGSNLRFEWSKKRGWYKAGVRRQLLRPDDPTFGPAVPLFQETLSDFCEKIFHKQRWRRVVVFCEYWGPNSLAGRHSPEDKGNMHLTPIDVAPYQKGILPPTAFLKLFGELGPRYLGFLHWTLDFVHRVMMGEIEGSSFEGVVGKAAERKKLFLYKAKRQAWKDEVLKRFPREGLKIIQS